MKCPKVLNFPYIYISVHACTIYYATKKQYKLQISHLDFLVFQCF